MSQAHPKNQRDLIRSLASIPLRLPRTARELFDWFALYDPSRGLDAALDRLDFSGVTPIDVYRLVHGRAPDGLAQAIGGEGYDARRHFAGALRSREFRDHIIRMLLAAYPEKRRLVFLHVPKCAGTDLVLNTAPNRLAVPHLLGFEDWLPHETFVAALGDLARVAPFFEEFFIYGHIEFGEYLSNHGVRRGDRFFTIIRDPFELLLSQANYAVSRLCMDPEGRDPDTRVTLDLLGLKRLPEDASKAQLKELAARCLLDQRIAQPNRICFYLGRQRFAPYERVIANLVANDVEITTADCYERWLADRWGITTSARHNRSTHFLTPREARRLFSGSVAEAVAEDQKLYDVVCWALAQSGRSSVTGVEIARAAGAALSEELPARLAAARPLPAEELVAAVGPEPVSLYLEPAAQALAPAHRAITEVVAIGFGADGNSKPHKGEGWYGAEKTFSWASGPVTRTTFRRPDESGRHVLRLIGAPFVARPQLASQRVAISVNGAPLGEAVLEDFAVLETEVPWEVLDRGGTVEVALTLPDATPAHRVKQVSDERTLGIAVRSLTLLRMGPGEPAPQPAAVATEEAPASLVLGFESLGENCEFGLVQRQCGAEPLGLLRFSSTPYEPLLRAMRSRFAGLGRPEFLEVEIAESGREYMIFDSRFGFRYHAWVNVGEMQPYDIHAREVRRLPLLIRKLVEDLTEGQKIFVYHGMRPLSEEEARELAEAVRSYGSGTLLWVERADAMHPPGSVVRVAPGLLKGHMDRFAPGDNAHDLSLDCWITLCRNARAAMARGEAA